MGAKSKIEGIGRRLRAIREQESLTLKDVSERTDISISTLSKLENGRTSLSFTTALQLSEGLGIPLMVFTSSEPVTATGRRAITRRGKGRFHRAQFMDLEVLCGEVTQVANVFWRVTITARSLDEYEAWRRHPGEEFLYVLSGRLELHTEFYEPAVLEQGDSIFFDSSMGHAYVAASKTPPVILMSNCATSTASGGGEPASGCGNKRAGTNGKGRARSLPGQR